MKYRWDAVVGGFVEDVVVPRSVASSENVAELFRRVEALEARVRELEAHFVKPVGDDGK